MATNSPSVGYSPANSYRPSRDYYGPPARQSIPQAIFVIIVLVVVLAILYAFAWPRIQGQGLMATSYEKWQQVDLWELLTSPITAYQNLVERQTAVFRGDIAETQEARENLEIVASQIKTLGQQFRPGEEIITYMSLAFRNQKGQEFETSASCKENKGSSPELYPGTDFIIATSQQDIDCKFSSLEAGAHTITMNVGIDYLGVSLLPQFFLTKPLYQELERDGKDFFVEYLPSYTGPRQSVSYTGPIDFGLSMQTQPLIVDMEQAGKEYYLVMSAENRLGGKIDHFRTIILRIPKAFRLDRVSNAGTPEAITCGEIPADLAIPCNDELFNAYRIPVNKRDLQRTETFRAILVLEDPESLIVNRENDAHEFAAGVDVTYSFERTATIYVKPEEPVDGSDPLPPPGQLS